MDFVKIKIDGVEGEVHIDDIFLKPVHVRRRGLCITATFQLPKEIVQKYNIKTGERVRLAYFGKEPPIQHEEESQG